MGPRSAPRGRAAAAVEEAQLDPARIGVGQQPLLRGVQLPLAGQETTILGGVRELPEHDLLAPEQSGQLRGVQRVLVQRGHCRLRPVEILDRLEQRHERQHRQLSGADPDAASDTSAARTSDGRSTIGSITLPSACGSSRRPAAIAANASGGDPAPSSRTVVSRSVRSSSCAAAKPAASGSIAERRSCADSRTSSAARWNPNVRTWHNSLASAPSATRRELEDSRRETRGPPPAAEAHGKRAAARATRRRAAPT